MQSNHTDPIYNYWIGLRMRLASLFGVTKLTIHKGLPPTATNIRPLGGCSPEHQRCIDFC